MGLAHRRFWAAPQLPPTPQARPQPRQTCPPARHRHPHPRSAPPRPPRAASTAPPHQAAAPQDRPAAQGRLGRAPPNVPSPHGSCGGALPVGPALRGALRPPELTVRKGGGVTAASGPLHSRPEPHKRAPGPARYAPRPPPPPAPALRAPAAAFHSPPAPSSSSTRPARCPGAAGEGATGCPESPLVPRSRPAPLWGGLHGSPDPHPCIIQVSL